MYFEIIIVVIAIITTITTITVMHIENKCFIMALTGYRSGSFKGKRKNTNRHQPRRTSTGMMPLATTLAIPQLDAIQRSQKLLDVRLQHLQANNKDFNRLTDDVEFIRRLMADNQKVSSFRSSKLFFKRTFILMK
jgi:hypothetical protein